MVVASYPRSPSKSRALLRISAFVCSPFTVLVDLLFSAEFIWSPRQTGRAADLITMLGNHRHYAPCSRQQLGRRQTVSPFAITAQRPQNHQPCLGPKIDGAFIADHREIFRGQVVIQLRVTPAGRVRLDWNHLEFNQLRLLGEPPLDSPAQSAFRVKQKDRKSTRLNSSHGYIS